MTGTYIDQYNRIKRLLKICQDQYALNGHSGIPHDANQEQRDQILDAFYNLFMSIYHLKDWIKNDPNASVSGKDVENYVKNSLNLSLLADTANAVKHLLLETDSRFKARVSKDAGPVVEPILVGPLGTYPLGGFYGYSIVVETGVGRDVEALQFACSCLEEWEAFMRTHSLLI